MSRKTLFVFIVLSAVALLAMACTPAAAPAPTAAPPTAAPPPPATSAPAAPPAAPTAAGAAPTTAPAAPTTAPAASQYKLDLAGYKGPAPTQTVKLRIMRQAFGPNDEALWKDWYAKFTAAYPNVTFAEEIVPYGDLNPKLQTYVAAGDVPDIVMGKGDFVQSYAFNKIALPIGDYFTDAYLNDIFPAVRAQQSVEGKLYCTPWEQGNVLLYYNKDMYDKAGVTPPQSPDPTKGWTWDQAIEAWTKVNASLNPSGEPTVFALAPSGYGGGGAGSSYWYEGIYIRGQGDPNAAKDSTAYRTFIGVSPDGLKATGYVDTPEAVAGMKIYQSAFTKKLTSAVPIARAFEDAKAASRFQSITGAVRYGIPATAVNFKWAVTPAPHGKIFFNHTSGDCLIVSAKTKFPAEAVAFLAWIHNDAARVAWHTTWGSYPSRISIVDMTGKYKEYPFTLASESTKLGVATPLTPGFLEYFTAMNKATKDIALGADPAQRLTQVAKEIDELLSSYKK